MTAGRRQSRIDGKVVLVTGATRGIGAAVARRLAGSGAQVALLARSRDSLAKLAGTLHPSAAPFPADVRDRAGLAAAVAAVVDRFGGVDVVMANAGIALGGPIDSAEPQMLRDLVETNLIGTLNTVQATMPHLSARRGYLLISGSMAGAVPQPGIGYYAATKAALLSLVSTLRVEVRDRGVDVGVLLPAFIDTPLLQRGLATDAFRIMYRDGSWPYRLRDPLGIARSVERGMIRRSRRIVYPVALSPVATLPGLAANRFAERLLFPPALVRRAFDAYWSSFGR